MVRLERAQLDAPARRTRRRGSRGRRARGSARCGTRSAPAARRPRRAGSRRRHQAAIARADHGVGVGGVVEGDGLAGGHRPLRPAKRPRRRPGPPRTRRRPAGRGRSPGRRPRRRGRGAGPPRRASRARGAPGRSTAAAPGRHEHPARRPVDAPRRSGARRRRRGPCRRRCPTVTSSTASTVPTDLAAGGVDERAGPQRQAPAEEAAAAVGRRDEADVLAVGLLGRPQPERPPRAADLGLGQVADRQDDGGQLVLARASRARRTGPCRRRAPAAAGRRRRPPARSTRAWWPVARRVEAEPARPGEQPVELDVPVAFDAGVGRPAGRVRGHVGGDDRRLEVLASGRRRGGRCRAAGPRGGRRPRRRPSSSPSPTGRPRA